MFSINPSDGSTFGLANNGRRRRHPSPRKHKAIPRSASSLSQDLHGAVPATSRASEPSENARCRALELSPAGAAQTSLAMRGATELFPMKCLPFASRSGCSTEANGISDGLNKPSPEPSALSVAIASQLRRRATHRLVSRRSGRSRSANPRSKRI
jgi:hypothetical protein